MIASKIAHFSWESLHSLRVGGISTAVTELAAGQERLGNEVHVFTRMGLEQKEYALIDGVHYHRCPFGFDSSLAMEMYNMSYSMVHHFFGCENPHGFDIVHGHDWHVVPALDEVKKAGNKRVVWTLHSNQYGRDGNHFHNGSAETIHGLEWYGTYIADRLITCTQRMNGEAKWVHRVPEEKMRVIHNGVQAHRYDGWIDQGEVKKRVHVGPVDPTVLFIGRMTYQKGPDLLLEAVSEVLKDYPQARFVFVGDGYMKAHLHNVSYHLGVNHAVRFTGFLHENDKIDLLKACEVVCVPSRNEPFGIVVLEAWSAGKPVVAIHGTGAGELIWHDVTGLKVYGYPSSIAWGIKNIFSDFEKAGWMGRNGRLAAETEFAWDKIAAETLKVYEELI